MKKIIAMMLCLILALGCFAAVAETAAKTQLGKVGVDNVFTLQCTIPADYQMKDENKMFGEAGCLILFTTDNAEKPVILLSVAFNELYSNVERMNDLSDEELAAIEETFREEDQVDISYMETAYGTKVMVVKEVLDGIDYVDFYTIYKGYEVEIVMTSQYDAENAKPITEEQIQMAIQFFSDMDFIPAE